MTTARIFHNPRCSKSRQTLAIIEESGVAVEVVKYLEKPPAAEELLKLCEMLGQSPLEITRTKEALFKELGYSKSDERSDQEWAGILAANPKLIERPIVQRGDRAVMGRPPESVESLLK